MIHENIDSRSAQVPVTGEKAGAYSLRGPEILGTVLWLMMHSQLHRNWFVHDLQRLVLPPVQLMQFRLYRTEERYFAFVSWAWLTEEAERGFISGNRLLQPEDWRAGDRLWFIDFIAPFGGTTQVARDLCENAFSEDRFRFLRRDERGEIRDVRQWHGVNYARRRHEERSAEAVL